MSRYVKSRAVITVGPEVTVKRFFKPAQAEHELEFYLAFPWACPRLISYDEEGRLVIETHSIADALPPDPPPVAELADLLHRLAAENVHHRDVHPGNIALTADGPRLIDWETAIIQPDTVSYDLYGPKVSGISPPEIHLALSGRYQMWWGSGHPKSIKNQWRSDVPTPVA